MKSFIHENFLLSNKKAIDLYHEYSENQPVIDFHCHLSPAMIDEDRHFNNLTEAWLEGDHYKWRAMRANGISEEYCTGSASPKDKFLKWAETVPFTVANPLYHWTHLELARYFNITGLLSPATAESIYEKASAQLSSGELSTKSILRLMKVEVVCTTDDPADPLEHHLNLKKTFEIKVLPTFRPDNIIKIDDPEAFTAYVHRLAKASGIDINDFSSLIDALDSRHSFFNAIGCRLSDHGMERFYDADFSSGDADRIFRILLKGQTVSYEEAEKYKTAVLFEICKMNHMRNWTQQFHVGAARNNNARMFRLLGPDTGWDSIGRPQDPSKISGFLSRLDSENCLARTILYNLNPADNEMMITMAGSFNDGAAPVKVQYGAAWWFLDQRQGMEKHLNDLASFGLLRRFVGMVTDSRSFLSYPRHEYFRRIACNFIGEVVGKGLIPDDDSLLKPLIEGLSYKNAKEYFGF
jgi:glucuronate isomerase